MKKKEHDFSTKQGVMDAIKWECESQGIGLDAQIAYVLATVDLETGGCFEPIKESFWLSEKWRRKNLRYYPYYGRGFVQLTWRRNYRKYSKILDIDLESNPNLVMKPNISLFILVHGFKNGVFTGKRLDQYVNIDKCDFVNARRCINGTDKAVEIAEMAGDYLENLKKERYPEVRLSVPKPIATYVKGICTAYRGANGYSI